ncbi:MAG: iron chelate uptake ABC transporter family permease subunit, partial [Actinomycetota bacterium]
LGALLGALGAAALLYGLTWRRGVTGERLVLVGIAVEAVLTALTTMVFVRFPIETVAPAVLWATGTLHARTFTHVTWLAVGLVVLVPLAAVALPRLRALQLGDEAATAVGIRVQPTRAAIMALAAGLAAVAVSAAGPVAFVALMVPHLARLLLGTPTLGVLTLTALLGALLVLLSDVLAQHALPASLPVGIVTAAVGAPYFLFLLHRIHRGS